VKEPSVSAAKLSQRDLSRWRLVEDFQDRLKQAAGSQGLAATWSDPQRQCSHEDYLSLFLLGVLNPVVRTMRGLCEASQLTRVQDEVCSRPVSLGSFSEAQAVVEPLLLAKVLDQLREEMPAPAKASPPHRQWLIQDGSLFEALPRMYWALWRRQGKAQSQVRLHLSLDLEGDCPARVVITPGKHCERAAWRTQWRRGDSYVGDRYYGEDYQMFGELEQAGVAFVVRLRDEAVMEVEEELALSQADQQAGVIRHAWVRLGCRARYRSIRLRVIWVQTPKEVLRLVTNLAVEELSAAEVALLYKERWQIELFFRWIKCILGCRHWLAESPTGTAIQIYLALIAALLLQRYTGQRPNRRIMELIQFYLLGVATLDELWAGLKRQQAKAQKKS
jgi:Transposase DDE domain